MARPSFTDHPEFLHISALVNNALEDLANSVGSAGMLHSAALESRVNRIADDLTRIMLVVHDDARKVEAA